MPELSDTLLHTRMLLKIFMPEDDGIKPIIIEEINQHLAVLNKKSNVRYLIKEKGSSDAEPYYAAKEGLHYTPFLAEALVFMTRAEAEAEPYEPFLEEIVEMEFLN